MGDRAYANAPGIHHVVSNGGDVWYAPGGTASNYMTNWGKNRSYRVSKTAKIARGWRFARVHSPRQDFIAGRICAVKKSVSAANRERKRILKEASKKCRKVKPQTLEAAGYTFVFTTLDQSIPAETI